MALENLISVEFTQEELQKIDGLLTQLEEALKPKFINLTTDQRKELARVGVKTEGWVARVQGYMAQYPDLVLRHIDTAEFNKDFTARQALLPRLNRLQALTARVDDTALLLGSDLYNTSIAYYKGIKAMADSNAPNAKVVHTDLKQQFPGRPNAKKTEEAETSN